jgi:hypothetical protein
MGIDNDAEFATAVAEALVEIFDLDFGACWLREADGTLRQAPGMLGLAVDAQVLQDAGSWLALDQARSPQRDVWILDAEALTPCRVRSGHQPGDLLPAAVMRKAGPMPCCFAE